MVKECKKMVIGTMLLADRDDAISYMVVHYDKDADRTAAL